MKIDIEIRSNRLPQIAGRLRPGLRAAVQKTVADVESGAKQRAPVDTGALRASIHGAMTGDTEGEVSVGASYGVYQEYGTVNAPAQPFMHPAADAARPGFEAAVRQLVEGL